MPITQELVDLYTSKTQVSQDSGKSKALKGLAWVGDKLSTAQYAMTGILAGKGAKWGIEHKYTPSFALGIENPWAAFAVDVVFDPLNLVGIGAMTKVVKVGSAGEKLLQFAEKGERAATLYGQAVKGERALLTLDIPFVKELQGISLTPKVVNEAVFGALTKGTEYMKQFTNISFKAAGETYKPLGIINKAAEAVRIRPALKGLDSFNLASIEKKASEVDQVFRTTRAIDIEKAGFTAKVGQQLTAVSARLDEALTTFGADKADIAGQVLKNIEDGVTEIPEILKPIAKEMRQMADDLGVEWSIHGGSRLEGKVLPKVLKESSELEAAGFGRTNRIFGGAARIFGGSNASRKFDSYTEFVNKAGKVFEGWSGSGKRAALTNGLDLVEVEDGVYMLDKVYTAIQRGKEELPKLIKKVETQIAKAGKDGVEVDPVVLEQLNLLKRVEGTLSVEAFKAVAPEQFFTRKAAGIAASERIAGAFGRALEFEKDPAKLLSVKTARVASQRASFQFIEQMKTIGQKVPLKAELPAGYARSTHQALKGLAFPEEVIKHIDSVYENYSSLEGVSKFYENFIAVHNLWKSQLTFLNVAFHTRNFVSNMWNLHLAGVYDPAIFAKSAKIMWANRYEAWKGKRMVLDLLEGADKQLYSEFVTQGLGGTGRFTAEFSGISNKVQNSRFMSAFKSIGAANEDFAKFALFAQRRGAGMSAADAAEEVRKYLFDYSDLSQVEKKYIKNIFSFYTWPRKNIPLQVAMLIQKPGKINDIRSLQLAMERNAEGEPMDESLLPEWLREGYPVYMGTSPDGMQQFIKLEGFLPTVDLDTFLDPSQTGDLVKNGFNGLITTPLDMLRNKDSFLDKEISEYNGQKKKFFGVYLPAQVEYAFSKIRPLNDLQKAFGMNDQEKIASAKERTLQYIIGKIYSYDEGVQRKYFDYLKSYQAQEVKKDMEKAAAKGDMEQYQRLQEVLIQIENGEGLAL